MLKSLNWPTPTAAKVIADLRIAQHRDPLRRPPRIHYISREDFTTLLAEMGIDKTPEETDDLKILGVPIRFYEVKQS